MFLVSLFNLKLLYRLLNLFELYILRLCLRLFALCASTRLTLSLLSLLLCVDILRCCLPSGVKSLDR